MKTINAASLAHSSLLMLLVIASALVLSPARAADPVVEMNDFAKWVPDHANITLLPPSDNDPTGGQRMRIDFEAVPNANNPPFPSARIVASSPWDLSGKCITLRLTNPTSEIEGIEASITDVPGFPRVVEGRGGNIYVAPGETLTCSFNCAPRQATDGDFRSIVPPPIPGMPSMGGYPDKVDTSRVASLAIHVYPGAQLKSIIVEQIACPRVTPISTTGLVDAYGQFSSYNWPGKILRDADFKSQRADEAKDLAAHGDVGAVDKYGGWSAGPTLAATGFFRTEKVGGKWWLVDPDGHLFWSSGFNCVVSEQRTIVDGQRAQYFSWLPKPGEKFANHYGETDVTVYAHRSQGQDFDFYGANLERKFGPKYLKRWRDESLRRLRSWGFNTIGNWSPDLAPNDKVPYVITIEPSGNYATINGYARWIPMPDPFDPQFAVAVHTALTQAAHKSATDSWCLGYFVQNELAWGFGHDFYSREGLAQSTAFMNAAQSPAKSAFVAELKAKYGSVSSLSAAWGKEFASWDEVGASFYLLPAEGTRAGADYIDFTKHFEDQYFGEIREEIRRVDPNHLYLGCRFIDYSWDLVAEAAKYCDVISFTNYNDIVDPKEWSFLAKYDKPCLVDEYSFGAEDRGLFNAGMYFALNQTKRADYFQKYVDSALASPMFVGAHWFQYLDQPLTGRAMDGEAGEFGFVSITDTPYPEMVAAARAVHARMYGERYGKSSAAN